MSEPPDRAKGDGGDARVSLAEVERQLRDLLGANGVATTKIAAVAAGATALAVGFASVYLLGRHKGRRRASVLEIRRV